MIIDGSGLIMGRLASVAARKLLQREPITIVNCSKVIVNGTPKEVADNLKRKLNLGTTRWGPFVPRTPARLMRRAVRGMLPYKKPRGAEAFNLLACHSDIPEELKNEKFEKLEEINTKKLRIYKRISLGELCKRVSGFKGAK